MATQTSEPPSPASGPEIRLGSPSKGGRMNIPAETIAAIEAAAGQSAPPAPQPIAVTAPPPEPPKPAPTPPAGNGEPKPAPKAAVEPPKPVPAPPKSDKEENLAKLREKAERLEREAAEARTSVTTTAKEKADAELKLAEANVKLAAALEREEKDYKPARERLKVVEQELQKREEVLKVKAYTETAEFHERYVKPLADAQGEVNELLGELVVQNDDGTARVATMDDFNEILAARSLNDAHAIASKKFGPIAPTVVNFRTRIRGLERTRAEASKRAGEMALEYEQRKQTEMVQQHQQFRTAVYTEAERLLKERLQVDDNDPEEKEAFATAVREADSLWDNHESVEQMVRKAATARTKNIEAPVLKKKLDKATARIAELETLLKDYEKSEPKLEPRGGAATPSTPAVGDKPERAALLAAAQAAAASTR